MPTNFPTSVDNFTNPTANDSLNLPSHSTQHANANDAIEAVEDYLLNGGQGMTLVKKQVVGTAVSSVILTSAFSATYQNYRVLYTGGVASSTNYIEVQMRVGSTTSTSSYYSSIMGSNYSGGSIGAAGSNNAASWPYVGYGYGAAFVILDMEIRQPFITKNTVFSSYASLVNQPIVGGGYHDQQVSYDQIVITPQGGVTLTGGTIYVYGYGVGQ